VGETTFGKGLVQRVIPLQDGGALAVTTAKYYTPSHRLIQRDYSDLEEYYLNPGEEVPPPPPDTEVDEDTASVVPDPLEPEIPPDAPEDDREIYYTAGGRTVYGGGGIRPDYQVSTPRAPELLLLLLRENLIFDFAVLYSNAHPELQPGFEVGDTVITEFRSFLDDRDFEYESEEFETHRDVVTLRLRAQIARVRWTAEEEARILASADPQVQKALSLFDEAAELAGLEIAWDSGLRAEIDGGSDDASSR
jgi:carboxyl-terminal processing protease